MGVEPTAELSLVRLKAGCLRPLGDAPVRRDGRSGGARTPENGFGDRHVANYITDLSKNGGWRARACKGHFGAEEPDRLGVTGRIRTDDERVTTSSLGPLGDGHTQAVLIGGKGMKRGPVGCGAPKRSL